MMQKTAIITGSSRGIGAQTAKLLAQNGYNVVVNFNKNEKAAREVVRSIGNSGKEALCFQADVSDANQAQALVDFAKQNYGTIDLLVNNAGIAHFSLADTTTDEQWRTVFAVNCDSVFYMTRAVLKVMLKQHRGSIINIGSMWGQVGAACESAYSASKAAVVGYSKAVAKEVGASGIMVNCICPGMIDTEMNSALSESDKQAVIGDIPLQRIGTAQDVAKTVLSVAENEYMTGQVIAVNGGLII